MFFSRQKAEAEARNRRALHRELPRDVGPMTAVLSGPAMQPLEGQLVDLHMGGIGVRLAGRRNADLLVGGLYQVVIGSQVHPDVVTPVQLRAAFEVDGAWRYGFEFVDVGGLHAQLGDFFVRCFNRRADARMRLMAPERIELTMEWDGGRRAVPVSDISAGGVGFALSAQDLPALEVGARVGVRFRLPAGSEELEGHATLTHMTLLAERFVLGLAFDLEEPQGLVRWKAQLDRFVRERLQVRAAWNALAG